MQIIKERRFQGQTDILTAPYAIEGLADTYAPALMKLIQTLPEESQSHILATAGTVDALVKNGQAAEVWRMIEQRSRHSRIDIFATAFAVNGLAFAGYGPQIIAFIASLAKHEQTRILSEYLAVQSLQSHDSEDLVFSIIQNLDVNQQSIIFKKHPAVYSLLSVPDRAPDILAMIQAFKSEDICFVISKSQMVERLADLGHADAIVGMIQRLSSKDKAFVLYCIAGVLSEHGHASTVIGWLSEMHKMEQWNILSSYRTLKALISNGQSVPLLELMRAHPQNDHQDYVAMVKALAECGILLFENEADHALT